MTTFGKSNENSSNVIRISYHAKSHYNSIVDDNIDPNSLNRVISHDIGAMENRSIAMLRINKGLDSEENDLNKEEAKNGVREELNNLLSSDKHMIERYKDIVQNSRQEYLDQGSRDLEVALQESLKAYESNLPTSKADDEETKAMELSKKEFEAEQDEQIMMKLAMEESMKNNPNIQLANTFDEQMMNQVMIQSTQNLNTNMGLENNPVAQSLLAMGFSQAKIMECLQLYGSDAEAVANYCMTNFD